MEKKRSRDPSETEPGASQGKDWRKFWIDHSNCGGTWVYFNDPENPRVVCSCGMERSQGQDDRSPVVNFRKTGRRSRPTHNRCHFCRFSFVLTQPIISLWLRGSISSHSQ